MMHVKALKGCAAAHRDPVWQGRWSEKGLLMYRSEDPKLLILHQDMQSMNKWFGV